MSDFETHSSTAPSAIVSGEVDYAYQYRIADNKDGYFVCALLRNNEIIGDIFECSTHEEVFAWLQLVMGSYQGTHKVG